MNVTWALAKIGIDEAEKAAQAASSWHGAHSYAIQREEDERAARRRAAIAKMNDFYQARRREKQAAQAKAAALAATRGPGWKLIDRDPRELEALAKQVWAEGFSAIPFPARWRVRWGHLRASNPGVVVFGRAVRSARVIVIDAAAHRTGRELVTTLLHELCHVVHGPEARHGPAFADTLQRVLDHVMPADELVTAAAPLSAPTRLRHPEPPRGQRWGPAGFFAQSGLESDLEYRG
jgi:hypothetical protein